MALAALDEAFAQPLQLPSMAAMNCTSCLSWLLPSIGAAGTKSMSSLAGKAPRFALALNGASCSMGLSKEQLLEKHKGAYTTARTVDGSKIFELSMHCSRLLGTASAILEKEAPSAAGEKARAFLHSVGAEGLKPIVQQEISTALKLLNESGGPGAETQVTILLTWDSVGAHTPEGRGLDMFTFVQPMPSMLPMVDVQALKAERNNPTIKDIQWTKDRKYLEEAQKLAGVNEVIMYHGDGGVTEGLQTNFFAIAADGTLLTAPDAHVLSGTVRKVVLEVAQQNNVPVRFECPNIRDIASWDSCFICSTSRLVKPILRLAAPEFCDVRSFPCEGSVAHQIETLVINAVRANSEPLS